MNSMVFGVGEFKYGNKNFNGAKGVVITIKFRLIVFKYATVSEFLREQRAL